MSALLQAAERGPLSPAQQQQLYAQYESAARARGEVPAMRPGLPSTTGRRLLRRFVRRHYLPAVLVLAKMATAGHAVAYAIARVAAADFPTALLGQLFAWIAKTPTRHGEDAFHRHERLRRLARRGAPELVEILAMIIAVPDGVLRVTRLRADIAIMQRAEARRRWLSQSVVDDATITPAQPAREPIRVHPIEGARRVTGAVRPLVRAAR